MIIEEFLNAKSLPDHKTASQEGSIHHYVSDHTPVLLLAHQIAEDTKNWNVKVERLEYEQWSS